MVSVWCVVARKYYGGQSLYIYIYIYIYIYMIHIRNYMQRIWTA